MDEHLESFYLWLQDNGFKPDKTKTDWTGTVSVEWKNIETGEWEIAEHAVTIWLPEGFPYHAPVVLSKDEPPLTPSWHLNPGDPLILCLWDSERGWKPDFTAHKLLNRISDWFYYYHTDTWPVDSQVPDLHRYLNHRGMVIIGEDWNPAPKLKHGQFTLWQSTKFDSTPDIASCAGDHNEPESRIADNIVIGSNPRRVRGAWFRVPQPFVPSGRLDILLSQLDELTQESSGWSLQTCIATVGIKATGAGFPITIGYPDNLGEERWLFLWGQFPERKGKRFKWSSHQNLRQVEVKSFQTAPASKDALLRRSAYISSSLTPKRVAVFGVGALGSSISLLLAKAGIGKLRLIDSDRLMPGNAMRHICGLPYVGIHKTAAVKRVINRHNPDCEVECCEATWDKIKLSAYIAGCDLVLDATGNNNFSLYLNKICFELDQPIVFAAAYRRARVGRVIMRFNSEDPCLECYLGYREAWTDDEYPIIPPAPDGSFIEDGCGSVTEEAVALDVEAVANFSARQAVRFLRGIREGNNLGLIVNEPLADVDGQVLRSPGMHFWTNRPYMNCSICGR